LAGDAQCIRVLATLPFTNNVSNYAFSTITSLGTGVSGVLNVRMINIGGVPLNSWPWEYFYQYFYGIGLSTAVPTDWAQLGQGAAGTLYFSPVPNGSFSANLDVVGYPIALVDDSTVEAIPFPWTDCVPYFAAYLALMSAQTNARIADAQRMLSLYNEFKERARRYVTATALPFQRSDSGLNVPVIPAGVEPPGQKQGAA
jgi:hypothetical protein